MKPLDKPLERITRCPRCGRTVRAHLTVADNGKWRIDPHHRLFEPPAVPPGEPPRMSCDASEGNWRLIGRGGAPSGGWVDDWKRPDARGL